MKKRKNRAKSIKILYLIGLLGMVGLLVSIRFSRVRQINGPLYGDYERIEKGWYLKESGETVDLERLGNSVKGDETSMVIAYQLPKLTENRTLFFRSKDVTIKVSIDGALLYETKSYESRFYNRSPGNLWNSVKIPQTASGKELSVEILFAYDKSAVTFDHVFLGEKGDILHNIIDDKLGALCISMIVLLLGLALLIITPMPFYYRQVKNYAGMYLGLYAFLIGLWSLLETNVIQLFVEDGRGLQLLNNMIMIVDNLPLLFYLDCYYQLLKHRSVQIFCWIQVLYILFCSAMQYIGYYDMHDLLKGSWVFSYSNDLIMMGLAVYLSIRCIKLRRINKHMAFQLMGFLCLVISAFVSAVNYTAMDTMDRAVYLRPGMLGFVVCFTISSQINTCRLVKQGMKYNIVRELAYVDGLTGLKNRTAYLKKLEQLEENDEGSLGIVFFDINDLKLVNDQLGHEYGDQLIRIVAGVIQNSFGQEGCAYRIGGDEFCLLMEGDDLQLRYEKMRERFYLCMKQCNKEENFPREIVVAHGFSICQGLTGAKIDKAIAEADGYMYADKAQLKEKH